MKAVLKLILVPALIIIVGMACSFNVGDNSSSNADVSSTEEPAVIPTDEAVQAPTEDVSGQDTSASTAEAFTTFTFDEEPTDWTYWVQEGDEEKTSFNVEDGKFKVEITGKQTYLYFTYDAFTYDNVYIETVVENRGVNSQSVSLLCRYSEDEGWYEANFQNDGLYNVFAYDARKNSYDMLTSGGSNAIKQGKEVNAYGFSCNDKKLTLWANGTQVTEIKENKYALREGNVGFAVSSYDSLPVVVEFEEVTISEP